MQIIFFSSELNTINEWKSIHNIEDSTSCYDVETLEQKLDNEDQYILIVDFDSIASEFNKLIASDTVPKNTIVLERAPEIATGKMLIKHGIKAYGNSKMLTLHFMQMLETILNSKVWTYPALTLSLTKDISSPALNEDAIMLIQNKLSPKETEVIYHILDGLSNDTIALKLSITPRTVKAHISSIFSKLHVSDRISLVLLLK